jgi:5-methylcytosine-specific restriction protein A
MVIQVDLVHGEELTNKRLVDIFKVGTQGGMRRNSEANILVIVSDHTKQFYSDVWQDHILHYTGMGKTGDQQLDFMQNRTLNESKNNGVTVYLFEVFTSGKYAFQGQVKLAGKPYLKTQLDFQGNSRQVWIFPLEVINRKLPAIVPEETLGKEQEQREKQTRKLTNEELAEKLKKSREKTFIQKVVSNKYVRDEYVAEFARRRAGGKCQLCEKDAPFKDSDGTPFLEIHHVQWLSKGGKDATDNTVGLCPNCHRKMHVLDLKKDRSKLQEKIV